ncbi:MAG: hypothetical protein IJ400_05705 [Clostridia bacterium]|nr:hypothetical protein [Clostridia bacterium]
MDGKNLKRQNLNKKIIIYQMPILERILGIFSALFLTAIPIVGLILGFERKGAMIILLLLMISYCVFMYFTIFKTYICLDVESNKLIVRESFGFKKEELSLDSLISITVSDGMQVKKLFTIDINFRNSTKKIISWSAHPTCRLAMFRVYERQTKRLKSFSDKCNEYLNA